MADVRKRIEEAIKNGEIIYILYHGGSQPSTKRQIAPKKIRRGTVSAWCYTNQLSCPIPKNYLLSKIEVVTENHVAPEYSPFFEKQTEIPSPANLSQWVAQHNDELCALGWIVEYDAERVCLAQFKKLKNRTQRKTLDICLTKNTRGPSQANSPQGIALSIEPLGKAKQILRMPVGAEPDLKSVFYRKEEIVDFRGTPLFKVAVTCFGDDSPHDLATRPWCLESPTFTRLFKYLDKALGEFMRQAVIHAPNK